jgi:TonB family protein
VKHKLRCFLVALVFIELVVTSAIGQNQWQFRFDESSVKEPAPGLTGDFSEGAPLADTPADLHRSDSKPILIPEGMAVGMLIHKVDPEYPRVAKAARISGIVTLKATISKTGEILDLHVECGPAILQEYSLKAIREWKYRPYLSHGEPVDVRTTIKVTFALGGKKKLPFSKDSCPVE